MDKLTRCEASLCGEVIAEGDRRYPAYCAGCYHSLRRSSKATLAAERDKRLEAESKVRKLREALKYYGRCSGDGCWCRRGGESHRAARIALRETAD